MLLFRCLLHFLPEQSDESVYDSGVSVDHERLPMPYILTDMNALAPPPIAGVIAFIIGLYLQSVGQHKRSPFIAVPVNDVPDAVPVQVHPVEVLTDGYLDSSGTGAVGAVVGPPLLQLATLPRLLRRVGVHLTGHR